MMRRRTFLQGLAPGALAALSACGGGQGQSGPFRLLITSTIVPVAPISVIELAHNLGFYRRAGAPVELVRVQATPTAIAALRSGQGEMANVSFDTALQVVARGQIDLKAVVSPDKALPYVIIARDDINSVQQLEGKTFGIGMVGSVDYLQTRAVLSRLGVNSDELSYLALGQPNVRTQALAAGRIDATTATLGAWTAIPDKTGLHILVDPHRFHEAAPFISKVNVVSANTIATRRDEVEAVVRATIEASRAFAADHDLWVDAMHQARPDVSRAEIAQLATVYQDNWSVDGGLPAEDVQATTDALYDTPEFEGLRRVEPSEWVDNSFIDETLRQLAPTEGAQL